KISNVKVHCNAVTIEDDKIPHILPAIKSFPQFTLLMNVLYEVYNLDIDFDYEALCENELIFVDLFSVVIINYEFMYSFDGIHNEEKMLLKELAYNIAVSLDSVDYNTYTRRMIMTFILVWLCLVALTMFQFLVI